MSDGQPEEDEEGKGEPHPPGHPHHQLAVAQLRLDGDFLLDELELRLLQGLHSLVNCRAGSLLVDGNHCHNISFARIKVF